LQLEELSFHEATVLELSREGKTIHLVLAGVQHDGKIGSAEITFSAVRAIHRDGVSAATIGMEYPDGEVLSFRPGSAAADLIVEWNDFESGTSNTVEYKIAFGKIHFHADLSGTVSY
jgi:hypothetical protein